MHPNKFHPTYNRNRNGKDAASNPQPPNSLEKEVPVFPLRLLLPDITAVKKGTSTVLYDYSGRMLLILSYTWYTLPSTAERC